MAEEAKNKEAENEEAGEGSEGEASGGSSKMLIIIIAAVVVVALAGVGAYFFMSGSDEEMVKEEVVTPRTANFYDLPELLVNLASGGSATRFLKIKVKLEVGSPEDLAAIEKLAPRIIDDFQLYLRAMRVEDLSGSSGLYRLKEALLLRANQAAQPVEVHAVLINEFLIQ